MNLHTQNLIKELHLLDANLIELLNKSITQYANFSSTNSNMSHVQKTNNKITTAFGIRKKIIQELFGILVFDKNSLIAFNKNLINVEIIKLYEQRKYAMMFRKNEQNKNHQINCIFSDIKDILSSNTEK